MDNNATKLSVYSRLLVQSAKLGTYSTLFVSCFYTYVMDTDNQHLIGSAVYR